MIRGIVQWILTILNMLNAYFQTSLSKIAWFSSCLAIHHFDSLTSHPSGPWTLWTLNKLLLAYYNHNSGHWRGRGWIDIQADHATLELRLVTFSGFDRKQPGTMETICQSFSDIAKPFIKPYAVVYIITYSKNLDPRPHEHLRAQIFRKLKYWEYRTDLTQYLLGLIKHNCGGLVKFWYSVPEIFSVKVVIF
jgi:hypothetical protein